MVNVVNVISTLKKRVIGYLKIMFIKELIHKIKIKKQIEVFHKISFDHLTIF